MRSTQGTTVPSVSFWECTVFQTKVREHQKKIQPFEVSVRNVITGKPQTLTRDILRTNRQIFIIFLPTCLSSGAL